MTTTVSRLAADWQSCGLEPGAAVLVHSSLKRTLSRLRERGETASPQEVLESFRQAAGPTGTVLFPLFNFGFSRGLPFDLGHTPSEMGALTEAARLHPQAVRTGHPIYSFAVLGAQAERFCDVVNRSGYGPDSPFGLLRELDGTIAVLDLPDQHSMTFYHHVEELHEVPYRYHKVFRGPYTDRQGVTTEREFSLFVRDLERGVLTHVDPMGERLWERGLYRGERPNQGVGLRTIAARALYEAVSEVIRAGQAEGLLYRIEPPTAP